MMDDPEYEMTTDISPAYHIELRQDGSVWVEGEGLVRLESLTAAGCCSLPPARPDDLGTLFGIPPTAPVEPYAELLTRQLSEHERTCSGNTRRTGFDPYATFGLEQVPQSLPSDPALTPRTATPGCAIFSRRMVWS